MTTKQDRADAVRDAMEETRHEESMRKEEGLMEAVVADGVMSGLGRPPAFLRTSARRVAAGQYRVNVFVGPHPADARVAHSFFVTADGNGKILKSAPSIKRAYEPARLV